MVNDATLSVDIFDAIRTKLVALAPYVSNLTLTTTTAATINAVYNDKQPSRPQVTINPASYTEDNWKFGSSQGRKLINVNIDCYAENTLGVDQLFDQIAAYLKDETTGAISGLQLAAVASDYGFSSSGSNKYHVKSATFTYDRE
jgi:hypothetical protein